MILVQLTNQQVRHHATCKVGAGDCTWSLQSSLVGGGTHFVRPEGSMLLSISQLFPLSLRTIYLIHSLCYSVILSSRPPWYRNNYCRHSGKVVSSEVRIVMGFFAILLRSTAVEDYH